MAKRRKTKGTKGFKVETVDGGLSLDGGRHFVPWTRGELRGKVAVIDGVEFNDSPDFDPRMMHPTMRRDPNVATLEIRQAPKVTEPKRAKR